MAISQYILDSQEEKRRQVRIRGLALVRIRYFYVGLLGVVAVASGLLAKTSPHQLIIYGSVAIVGLVSNTIIGIILKSANRKPLAYGIGTYAAIILDISLATAVVFVQGGYPSRATVLYAVPILSSGVLLLAPSAYIIAGLSGLAYAGTLFIQYWRGVAPDNFATLASPALFYPVAFMILAAIVTRFSAANAVNENQVAYSQFLGMVRQQLKQSPATIAALLQKLEADASFANLTDQQRALFTRIKAENLQNSMTISSLVEGAQPKAPAQPQEDHTEYVDLAAITRQAAQNCALSAARIGDLDLQTAKDVLVKADGSQLRTAIYNILDNAFRYSIPGSAVEVVVEAAHKLAVLTITDQGRGMTNEQLRVVNQRSEQFEDNRPSDPSKVQLYTMGLGLHVSRLTIERFGGTLSIFSKPKIGTKVTIHLPKK